MDTSRGRRNNAIPSTAALRSLSESIYGQGLSSRKFAQRCSYYPFQDLRYDNRALKKSEFCKFYFDVSMLTRLGMDECLVAFRLTVRDEPVSQICFEPQTPVLSVHFFYLPYLLPVFKYKRPRASSSDRSAQTCSGEEKSSDLTSENWMSSCIP